MEKFIFKPEDGYENAAAFPDTLNEEENRKQLNELPKQLLAFLNKLTETLNSTKGAKEIGNEVIEMCKLPDGSYAANISDQLKIIVAKMVISDTTRYLRVSSEGILEYSKDGTYWRSTAGQTGPKGDGIPDGGIIGQYIVKTENGCQWADAEVEWGNVKGDINNQEDLIKKLESINAKSKRLDITIQVNQWSAEGVFRLENEFIKSSPETNQEWIMPSITNLSVEQYQTILALGLTDYAQGDGWTEVKATHIPAIDIPMIVILRGEV